jgi:hypothetical protein
MVAPRRWPGRRGLLPAAVLAGCPVEPDPEPSPPRIIDVAVLDADGAGDVDVSCARLDADGEPAETTDGVGRCRFEVDGDASAAETRWTLDITAEGYAPMRAHEPWWPDPASTGRLPVITAWRSARWEAVRAGLDATGAGAILNAVATDAPTPVGCATVAAPRAGRAVYLGPDELPHLGLSATDPARGGALLLNLEPGPTEFGFGGDAITVDVTEARITWVTLTAPGCPATP